MNKLYQFFFIIIMFGSLYVFAGSASEIDIADVEETLQNQGSDFDIQEFKEDSSSSFTATNVAEIILLNKITAKSSPYLMKIGEARLFGNISIEVKACVKGDDPFERDNFMLIKVCQHKTDSDNICIFDAWILSSNPSLSNFEHPVYEIIALKCINSAK